MTIHPKYPGLSAEIVVDGGALEEYDEDDHGAGASSKFVTKYVRVDDDVCFGVRYTIPKGLTGQFGLRGRLKIDGFNARSCIHSPDPILGHDVTKCLDKLHSTVDGVNYTQKFRFSKLQMVEEEPELDEAKRSQLKNVGCLTLSLSLIHSITKRSVPLENTQDSGPAQAKTLPMLGEVSEKSFKASMHQLPKVQISPAVARTSTTGGEPFAIFHFKYRSTAALKSLHIIPRTPSPPSTRPIRAIGEMSGEELEAIVRASQRSQTQTVKQETSAAIKRERARDDAEDEVEFVSSKRLKSTPSRRDEIIILD